MVSAGGRLIVHGGNRSTNGAAFVPLSDTFVIANNQGVFTFPDMPLGSYLIQAPGPSVDSLIEFMENNGIDPRSAFTTGDAPGGLGDAPASSSDTNAVLAAYQDAVQRFFSVDESLLGLPMWQPLTIEATSPMGKANHRLGATRARAAHVWNRSGTTARMTASRRITLL